MVTSYLLLIVAAFCAGLINSVAGGGSFLTFPALVFTGVPSIIANASNTVALMPGSLASAWGYRDDFKADPRFPYRPILAASLAGGVLGALLLLLTPERTFDALIPWLMLAATLLFAVGPRVAPMLQRRVHIGPVTVVALQFFIAIYGGYFGGAIGILMLAAWAVLGLTNIHAMNANKTLLAGVINAIAAALFIFARKVWWPQTMVMLVASVIGGYAGARWAKRMDPRHVRVVVIIVSASITAAFFLRGR